MTLQLFDSGILIEEYNSNDKRDVSDKRKLWCKNVRHLSGKYYIIIKELHNNVVALTDEEIERMKKRLYYFKKETARVTN